MRKGWIWMVVATSVVGVDRLDAQIEPERVAVGVISTDRNETFPAEDPVTGALWFSVYDGRFDVQTIMVAERSGDGWEMPRVAPFSGRWGDRAPRFSPDGSVLYFTSNRPRTADGQTGELDLWSVRRTPAGWSEPELLEAPFNSAERDMHASVTADALWLSSYREGTLGRADVFRVSWDGRVTNPGPTVNSELGQTDLWVSADGSVMIVVVTDAPGGFGGDDLYLTRFDGTSWSEPVNLGAGINTDEYEYGPSLSADGRYLLFTSHRSGSADVYRVPMDRVLAVGR